MTLSTKPAVVVTQADINAIAECTAENSHSEAIYMLAKLSHLPVTIGKAKEAFDAHMLHGELTMAIRTRREAAFHEAMLEIARHVDADTFAKLHRAF